MVMDSLLIHSTLNFFTLHSTLNPKKSSPFFKKLYKPPKKHNISPIKSSSNFNSNQNSRPNPFSTILPILQKWVSLLNPKQQNNSPNNGVNVQNGAFGTALLSLTANARVRISPFVATLANNPTFMSGFFAWFIAQSLKVFLNFFVERKWDFRVFFSSGGMPSSHTALCTGLTTSVALCHGVADSLFPVCLGFTLIVMYDAIGVRRHAGMQAEVLNMIVADLFQGHPVSQRKLKELLGHTPSQVLVGALLGIVVACICCQSYIVAT